MRRLVLEGNRQIAVEQASVPDVSDNQILVRVDQTAVCGSDRMLWRESASRVENWGHELLGTVVSSPCRRVPPQTRVTVRTTTACRRCGPCRTGHFENCKAWSRYAFNGFAEFVALPERLIVPIPHLREAPYVLVEPTYVALDLVRRANISAESRVLIVGCGPIGLITLLILKRHGIGSVRMVARATRTARANLAQAWGGDLIQGDDFRGCKLDCASAIVTAPYAAIAEVAEAVAYGGTIVYNGLTHRRTVEIDFLHLHTRRISLIPSFPHPQSDFSEAIGFVEENAATLKHLLTKVSGLSAAQECFVAMEQGEAILKLCFELDP
jgi:threonine dehydrogenase-like Zn-dependent dehydrogenase